MPDWNVREQIRAACGALVGLINSRALGGDRDSFRVAVSGVSSQDRHGLDSISISVSADSGGAA